MKKILQLIATLAVLCSACQKYNSLRDDINGNLYIRGRLFLINNITTAPDTTPLAAAIVNIGYAPDTINYIYSTKTDSNGYFVFNEVMAGKNYLITNSDSSGGVWYWAKSALTPDTSVNNLRLLAKPSQTVQNGVVFMVQDQAGKPVGGCSACLFTSLVLYRNALAADTCVGGSFNLLTNGYGLASQFGLPTDTLYTFFRIRANTLVLRGYDTVKIQPQGVVYPKAVVVK